MDEHYKSVNFYSIDRPLKTSSGTLKLYCSKSTKGRSRSVDQKICSNKGVGGGGANLGTTMLHWVPLIPLFPISEFCSMSFLPKKFGSILFRPKIFGSISLRPKDATKRRFLRKTKFSCLSPFYSPLRFKLLSRSVCAFRLIWGCKAPPKDTGKFAWGDETLSHRSFLSLSLSLSLFLISPHSRTFPVFPILHFKQECKIVCVSVLEGGCSREWVSESYIMIPISLRICQ